MDHTGQWLTNLYDLSRPALIRLLAHWGYSEYYADLIWDYVYRQDTGDIPDMDALRPELMMMLQEQTYLGHLQCERHLQSRDGTQKFLLRLADGQMIETVLMPYRDRYTACISTQAGCAMGCVFCATGQMGFDRHLSAGEIVAQVLFARRFAENNAPKRSLRNIVLMGMGEPLHNYEQTMTAIDILTDDRGLAIGPRYITLSTVGLAPAIRRMADEKCPINLAVSLHGATDAERRALVPVARRWSLDELIDACRYYSSHRNRRIFFEWTLIAGENDTEEQAHALGQLLHGLDAHVNLIPLNPTGAYSGRASRRSQIDRFKAILAEYDLPSTVRQRRGLDIDAGCGQLRQRVLSAETV